MDSLVRQWHFRHGQSSELDRSLGSSSCWAAHQVLQVANIEDRVKLKVSGLKDRASLLAELERIMPWDSERTQAKIGSTFAGGATYLPKSRKKG